MEYQPHRRLQNILDQAQLPQQFHLRLNFLSNLCLQVLQFLGYGPSGFLGVHVMEVDLGALTLVLFPRTLGEHQLRHRHGQGYLYGTKERRYLR